MNILVDVSVMELPETGISRVVKGLYRAVVERVPSLQLLGVHRRPLASKLPPGFRSDRIAPMLSARMWRRFAIPSAARRVSGSILHFPWNGGVPRLPDGTPVVTTMHDVLPLTIPGYFASEELERAYRRDRQLDIDRSSVVVTDSDFSKKELMRHLRMRREPVVIPCATDLGMVEGKAPVQSAPYFLYVGGLDPRKSVDMLLRVFLRLVAEKSLSARLVVTGTRRHAPASITVPLDEGMRRGCIVHTGYVDDRELAGLYTGALALIYPSQYEGFGMPPLEAMTLGCPVAACRATSIPEVCGEAAYYIEPGSERSLAEAIIALERNRELRHRLASEGRTRAAMFSWDRAAESFLRTLDDVFPDLRDPEL